MGDDEPAPGNFVFHCKLVFSSQVVGMLSELTPDPFGPRNLTQSPALTTWLNITKPSVINTVFMEHV